MHHIRPLYSLILIALFYAMFARDPYLLATAAILGTWGTLDEIVDAIKALTPK